MPSYNTNPIGLPYGDVFWCFWFFESRPKVENAASGVVSKASASVDLKIPLSPCLPLSWLFPKSSRNWMMPRMQAKDKEDVYQPIPTEWTYPGLPTKHPRMEISEQPKADKWRESIASKQRGSCNGTGPIAKGGGMTRS